MTSAAVIACVLNGLLGAVLPGGQSAAGNPKRGEAGRKLPGPAEGGAEFQYAEVQCSLTPSVVGPGEEAVLTVRLTPKTGATWHEARLVPSRVEIGPPEGWEAEAAELALLRPATPDGPREFTVRLTPRADEERGGQGERDGERTGRGVLELRIRYGVRVAGPSGYVSQAAGAASPEAISPEVVFEEATLAVELPAVLLAASLPTRGDRAPARRPAADGENRGEKGRGPGLPGGVASLPEAEGLDDERGSPLLPALFFAVATAMVFVGLALWMRARR